eukprot:scaffold94778_cov60-Cyclotella_meneghiniana.AAC.1
MGMIWAPGSPPFTPRLCVFGLSQAFHSSWTLPTSHHEYDEWQDKAENDPLIQHPDCVCLDCHKHFTAAGPFQCLIMSMMNGKTRLRLEFIH